MKESIKLARKAFFENEVPVGAVITDANNKIIAKAHNKTIKNCDPNAHAEIIAIKKACKKLGLLNLSACKIFVTLEPCPMCAFAIANAKISKIYIGATDFKTGGVGGAINIYQANLPIKAPEIYSGINEQECSELIKNFFQKLRGKNKNFF